MKKRIVLFILILGALAPLAAAALAIGYGIWGGTLHIPRFWMGVPVLLLFFYWGCRGYYRKITIPNTEGGPTDEKQLHV